jgi:hypothetical protein
MKLGFKLISLNSVDGGDRMASLSLATILLS